MIGANFWDVVVGARNKIVIVLLQWIMIGELVLGKYSILIG